MVFVEGDEKIKDFNKRNLQRPRVFYRRETETTPLVVAEALSAFKVIMKTRCERFELPATLNFCFALAAM